MESLRPKLRALDVVVIQDQQQGRVLLLHDTEGIAPSSVVVATEWSAVLARFDGARSVEEIAQDASRAAGRHIDAAAIARLAAELDSALMLDSPSFRARRSDVVQAFQDAPVRPAAHAGSAYHGERTKLADFIERQCLAAARPARVTEGENVRAPTAPGRMVGLCAPHMDLWRAAVGYGHAYAALAEAFATQEAEQIETFVILGTSHAAMRRPFAVCDKRFSTPFGGLDPDRAMIDEIAEGSSFDVHAEQYLHKNEHSIEFQTVFLSHLLGGRVASIVPILCGLSECQLRRRDPSLDERAESFLTALEGALSRRGRRVLVIAGADLAHIGPRFGDPRPLDERGRALLRRRDHASIERAAAVDPGGFFADVAEDLETRRVCGLGPVYTLLRALPPRSRGEVLHYDQCVEPDEGSIVSHASLAFYA